MRRLSDARARVVKHGCILEQRAHSTSCMSFDRDLLLLNDEKTLTLHDVPCRKDQLLLEDQDGIWRPTFCSGKTNLLATPTDDGRIKVWDLAARRVRVEFEGHPRSPMTSPSHTTENGWLRRVVITPPVRITPSNRGMSRREIQSQSGPCTAIPTARRASRSRPTRFYRVIVQP